MNEDEPATVGQTGFTVEDLSDYLERGRQPYDPEIESSPECLAMLDSIERLGALSRDLVARDVAQHPTVDETWLGGLLQAIGQEVRAGRDIPLSSPDPRTSLVITEGAVRELVRRAGDSVDGVLVGSCSLEGDVTDPEAPIRVSLTISVVLSVPVVALAEAVRQRVYSELLKHTELSIDSVDVTVSDVHQIVTPLEDTE